MTIHFHARTCLSVALFFIFISINSFASGQPGSSLLPVPRKMSLSDKTYPLDKTWKVVYASSMKADDAAVSSLMTEVSDRFDIDLQSAANAQNHFIRLQIKPSSVAIGNATDTNRAELQRQAYRVELNANNITITANASAGLFYGVQTLLQLLSPTATNVMFPIGTIEDWPDLEIRIIYWDDAHHLEKIKALKRAIKQAAHYKINGIALKLEGHFQYKTAKPIVEPYAYTPQEYQEITDFASKLHVQLIPFLDCPAHVSFILKHPEFSSLRAYPNNNYQFSVVNPKVDELIVGMFNELFDANKGSKYVFLSTDEAYYTGKPDNEQAAAKAAGGNGALLAKFITRIASEIHKRGRTPIIWGEYPLTNTDVPALPSYIVNGIYDSTVAALYKKQGIRQLIYTSTQGMEPYFPEYYNFPPHKFTVTDTTKSNLITDDEMMQGDLGRGRVEGLLKTISSAIALKNADFTGSIVAGWGDSGLNPETFWLGYCAGSAAGWNHEKMTASDLSRRFFSSFYGSDPAKMENIYKLMSSQSQFWDDSWELAPLQLRTPIVGNSEGMFDQPRHLKDQTLLPLPSDAGNLKEGSKNWNIANADRLDAARKYLDENKQLIGLLRQSLKSNDRQHFNLRIFISVAELCRQSLQMLLDVERINSMMSSDGSASVVMLDEVLHEATRIKNERNEVLRAVESTWYEEWFPRVPEANGRKFLDVVDDIKDHVPIRTVDMSYLIYRQLNYPMDKWWNSVMELRNKIASQNNLPLRTDRFNWNTQP